MRRVAGLSIRAFVLLAIAVLAIDAWRNPEQTALDAAARAGVPGRFVTLSPGVTHYEIGGPDSGRLVVLVHGNSVPYYIWDSTFAALQRSGIRVLRYDLYGRGYSDRPDVRYDGALYDRQLSELLDSLHVAGPVDLAGLSFGGFVTAHFLTSHPTRVRTLTLVDPVSASGTPPTLFRLPLAGAWFWQVTAVPRLAAGQVTDFLHPELHPTWVDQYRPQMRVKGFGRALRSSMLAASTVSYDSLYSAVGRAGIPVLLVWGRQDQTVPFAYSKMVRRGIPSAEFVPVDSAGHLPHIEQAALFNARLLAFLAAHPPAATR